MRITRIVVTGLFDRFNHDLEFKPDERITIMTAPNGFGKTTILRIVNSLFNHPIRSLARMPFRELDVSFDDATQLKVIRKPREASGNWKQTEIELIYKDKAAKQVRFSPKPKVSPKDLGISSGMIEDIIPDLDQVGPAEWRHRRTGETLEIEDVIERFGDIIGQFLPEVLQSLPGWLQKIRESIPVRFIDTERLTKPLPYEPRYARSHRPSRAAVTSRTVRRYSDELAAQAQKTLTEYGSLAQSLDRTFPARLVEEPSSSNLAMDQLRQELAKVEAKRSKLVDAGLLAKELEGWGAPALDKIDESRRGVLAVYARDAWQKLGVFDDLYVRVDALKRIADSRFLHKKVTAGTDGLGVIASDGSRLELEMLSSGEQHELVFLFELLFRVPINAFILFDEPELSLHVDWQEQFLNDLDGIANLSKFRVLLATHSPQIIGERWDLTVQLKGPNGE